MKLLFVDDEPYILEYIKRKIHDLRHISYFATTVEEARKILDEGEVAVVVTDYRMGEVDGLSFLKEVYEKDPKICRLLMTAQLYATSINVENMFYAEHTIQKPFDGEYELLDAIRSGLKSYIRSGSSDVRDGNL